MNAPSPSSGGSSVSTPTVDELSDVLDALRSWQVDLPTVPLHPGDVGWFWRFGADATAAALRTWSSAGRLRAVGLLDGATLLRVAVDPEAASDGALARRMADDIVSDRAPIVPAQGSVEARSFPALRDALLAEQWVADAPWAPLRLDLAEPVRSSDLRIRVVDPASAPERVMVQRSAFDSSTFTLERWRAMAGGPAYADARCLVAHDATGAAVATATVWSAGRGRPGLLEPVGVHREHRRRGYGVAISRAAAGALRAMGASSALVCTPSANAVAVATYRSAGFTPLAEVRDLQRADHP